MPSLEGSAARNLEPRRTAFGLRASAFAASALYQAYRVTLMEIPNDAVTGPIARFYVAALGGSALVLTDKRWAWRLVSALVLGLLAVGPFCYDPVVATARAMGPIDWLEGSLFAGLLIVAGFVSALPPFGVRLAVKKG